MRQLFSNTGTFVVLAVLGAGLVTGLILEVSPEGLGDWVRTLAATAISALFAVAIGIWLFNRQTEITDERRSQQLVEILEAEIRNIRDEVMTDDPAAFTPVMIEGGEFHQILLPEGLELITFDEVIRSGLLPTNVTVQLITLAGQIRAYDARVRRAQATLQTEAVNKKEVVERGSGYLLDTTPRFLESGRKTVREACEGMLTSLQQLKN